MVGTALVRALDADRVRVVRLVRKPGPGPGKVAWDPEHGTIEATHLEGVQMVVHLAGENIARRRWTSAQMRRIRDSRVQGTATLCRGLAKLAHRPRVLVSASAIGFYGDRGDETLTEDSSAGTGFLADVCKEWERAADAARSAGIRVVHLRFGLVLARQGGALARLLPVFRLGLGGPIGSGRQYLSWISLPDVVAVIRCALADEQLEGPVNACAPTPVTNREFARALGHALQRPARMPLPAFAARLLIGKLAPEALLASQRALPVRLQQSGFTFAHPTLDSALTAVLAGG